AFPATARAYAKWLPPRERGRVFGVAIATGLLTAGAAQPLVTTLLPIIGWRRCFGIFALVGVAWSVVWWIYFRDDPRAHRGVNRAELEVIGDDAELPKHHALPIGRML